MGQFVEAEPISTKIIQEGCAEPRGVRKTSPLSLTFCACHCTTPELLCYGEHEMLARISSISMVATKLKKGDASFLVVQSPSVYLKHKVCPLQTVLKGIRSFLGKSYLKLV